MLAPVAEPLPTRPLGVLDARSEIRVVAGPLAALRDADLAADRDR